MHLCEPRLFPSGRLGWVWQCSLRRASAMSLAAKSFVVVRSKTCWIFYSGVTTVRLSCTLSYGSPRAVVAL